MVDVAAGAGPALDRAGQHLDFPVGVGFEPVVVSAQGGEVAVVGGSAGCGITWSRSHITAGVGSRERQCRSRVRTHRARLGAGVSGRGRGRSKVIRSAPWHRVPVCSALSGPWPGSSGPAGVMITVPGPGRRRGARVSRATRVSRGRRRRRLRCWPPRRVARSSRLGFFCAQVRPGRPCRRTPG